MPFLRITLGKSLSATQQRDLARQVTERIATILHKRAAVTAVQIAELSAAGWFIGGDALDAARQPAHCELIITAGTNTAVEKADFIAALHRLLGEHGVVLPEASYIVIHEIPATDWGYDGLTQAFRQQQARQA